MVDVRLELLLIFVGLVIKYSIVFGCGCMVTWAICSDNIRALREENKKLREEISDK